jgi:8-oxo-dGTP diphosphatase
MHVNTFDWNTWNPTDDAVICFICHGDHLLLIEKKRGLGGGKVNGPGGKLEDGEDALAAAIRETEEEVGLRPQSPVRMAELSFVFLDGYSLRCDVFTATEYSGTMRETPEAKPFWCAIDAIPYERMWEDDALWLPRVLRGERLSARFIFGGDSMKSYTIHEGLLAGHRTGMNRISGDQAARRDA